MNTVVAIGGGEIGRAGHSVETRIIDKRILELSGKTNPKLLFLPTASGDDLGYEEVVRKYFGESLGCDVSALRLFSQPSETEVLDAVHDADIIYVGGGNTLRMMNLWRRRGFDEVLLKTSGKVLAGLSAGAICWMNEGLSDSRSFKNENNPWPYINVRGLGLYGVSLCPHFDADPKRRSALEHSLQRTPKTAVALDNCTAIELHGDSYRILNSSPGQNAYRAFWSGGKYFLEQLEIDQQLRPLESLLNRDVSFGLS